MATLQDGVVLAESLFVVHELGRRNPVCAQPDAGLPPVHLVAGARPGAQSDSAGAGAVVDATGGRGSCSTDPGTAR